MSGEIRATLGERRLAALKAEAERLEMSEQEYLRYALDLALNRRQAAAESPLDRRQIDAGGTYKEGGLAVSSPDPTLPSSSLSAETGGEGSSGGEVGQGGGVPVQGEKRKRDRRRAVEVPPPVLPESLAAVPGLPEALLAHAAFRRTSKHGPMTERAWKLLYNALAAYAGQYARLAVLFATAKGWATWEPGYMGRMSWDEVRTLLGEAAPSSTPATPRHPLLDRDLKGLAEAEWECEQLLEQHAVARGEAWRAAWQERVWEVGSDPPGMKRVLGELTDDLRRYEPAEPANDAALAGSGAGGPGRATAGPAAHSHGVAPPDSGELLF